MKLPKKALKTDYALMKTIRFLAIFALSYTSFLYAEDTRFTKAVTPDDFALAGLSKLSPLELYRLDQLIEQYKSGALTAAKQSRRFHIPAIGQLVSTEEISGENIFVLHESATSHFSQEITSILADTSEITLVIGPEGGISDAELAILAASGARSIRMGLPVFRSAHAGVAALSALQALLGKW